MKSCNVILDLTEDCNLRCKYCYINGGDNKNAMSLNTAINVVKKFSNSYNNGIVHLLFHGGEPMLMYPVMQSVVEYIEKNNINNLRLYIQTNGMNINEDVAVFLKNKNIHPCISIDGFTPETNATRISPVFNCEDTTRKILQGLDCLLSCGNDVSTICVLSKINVEYVKEYLNECANRGISLISMNPIIKLGRSLLNENLLLSNSQIIEAYIKVIEQLNKLLSEGKEIMERNVYYYCRRFFTKRPEYVCMNTPCGAGSCVFVIKCNGDIYPCSDFSFNSNLRLGNVNNKTLFSVEKDQSIDLLYSLYNDRLEHNVQCRMCSIKDRCPSGCSARKYLASGNLDGAKDPLCEVYKELYNYLNNAKKIDVFKKCVLDSKLHV